MSKDIWHTTDEIPEEDRVIVVKSKRTGEYLVGSEFEFILENFTKWAYFDDLLALETELEQSKTCCTEWEKQALDYKAENIALSGDLERTRKALDVAVDALKDFANAGKESEQEWFCMAVKNNAHKALEQITALEQKDHFADTSKKVKRKD